MLSKNKFRCSHCDALLNVKSDVIFAAKSSSGKKGLLYLSQTLGDYTMTKDDDFVLSEGESLTLICPVCHTDMSKKSPSKNLAKIIFEDEQKNRFDIYISAIVGEHCTYKIKGHKTFKFGKDSGKYDFLDLT